jgi:DNA polymerase-2
LTHLRRPSRSQKSDDQEPLGPSNVDGVASVVGAAKRYAGLCAEGKNGSGRRVVFVGMEAVRRDATDLCKEAQRTLHELLFTDRPAAELTNYLHRLVRDLRRGQLDAQLVYRKLLRKEPGSYHSLPPHVKVAQQLGLPVGRLVRYVITTGGPQPAFATTLPLHYDHYIDKQLRPAVQPVLTIYGLDFDQVVGKDLQLKLF